jgi:two-component system, chemotaxis family, CheB/CheR fusion protein
VQVFTQNAFCKRSRERLSRYFGRVDGKFQVSKAIRETCIFARQNVTRDAPFSHLDLISCRNVLIYFESILQTGILPLFHYALNPSGLLLLGTAEGVGSAPDLFSTVDHKYKIFARKPGQRRLHEPFTIYRDSTARVTEGQVATAAGGLDLQRRADRVIQERYAPPSVVINEDFQIVQFIGQTGFYLEPASGAASYGLLQMAQGALKYALREVVSRAIKENALVERKGIRVEQRGEVREISLEVVPLGKTADKQRCFLVVFRSLGPQEESNVARTPISPSTESVDEQVIRLRGELADSLAYQRVMAEGQDASLEDLRAANEELGSANEELQSSNEEVGTAREELQSANEELTTLNEELNTRNQQLGLLTDDLRNLFAAVSAPILKVDRDLCLRRITGAAASLGITPADLDHPVRLVQGRLGTLADVETLIHGVLKELTVHTYAMQDSESRWWSLSIRPYRTDDDRIDGAVLTFTDTDAIQRALRNSEQARRYADTIVRTVREPLVVLTRDLRVERANASFYRMFRVQADQTEQRSIYDMGDKQWDNPKLRSLLEEVLPKKKVVTDFEVTHALPGLGNRVMLLNAQEISNEEQVGNAILLAVEDVTERRRAEQAIANRLTTTDRELDRTKEELRALAAKLMNAHEEEQRRISRELHDDLAQSLAVFEIEVEQFRLEQKERSPAEVSEMLQLVQHRVAGLLQEIRSISHRMHPAILDDLGLVTALRSLVEEIGSLRSAPIHFQCETQPASLPREHAGAVYRIAQEALRNAVRHAPQAAVIVRLTCTAKQLRLKVKDTGPGFDPVAIRARGHLGIVSMQERAHLLGGDLKIQSRPGKGATFTLRIPLPPLGQKRAMAAVKS